MVCAVTGYACEDHMENGGDGLKLGFRRCCVSKVAQKTQRASTKDADGNTWHNERVIRKKGSFLQGHYGNRLKPRDFR